MNSNSDKRPGIGRSIRLGVVSVALIAAVVQAWAQGELYVKSYDGVYVAAAFRKPSGTGPFPALLFIHGRNGGLGMQPMKDWTHHRVPEHFHQLGYVVMSTDYRRYHFGEDEIQDVLAAYRTLESLPFVDKARIGVIGGSHGGYLAKMLATRITPAAVVSFAGLTDIEGKFFDDAQALRQSFQGWEEWRARLLTDPNPATGNARQEQTLDLAWHFGDRRELYRLISPKDNAARITCPILFLAGGNDILRIAGKSLIDDLRARGVKAEYSEHAGVGHGFYWGRDEPPPRQFYDALKATTDFVDRHVRR